MMRQIDVTPALHAALSSLQDALVDHLPGRDSWMPIDIAKAEIAEALLDSIAAARRVPPTWVDHQGRTWKTTTAGKRLRFRTASHAALRAFVFHRDHFTCTECEVKPETVPDAYDGRRTVWLAPLYDCLVMDHIVACVNGGSHHPSNLRTTCGHCNAVKSGLIDAPAALRLERAYAG